MKSLLCILLIFIALTCAQRTFHATSVTIRSIPNTIGSLSGDMYYDSTRALMQIEFVGLGVTEIYNFTDQVKYKKCSTTCDAESINYGDFGFYTPYPGESATSGFDCLTGGTKAAFTRPGANFQVVNIAFNNADQVCRAQLGNGMEFIFNSFGTGVGAYDFSSCPKKQCSQKLDIMVVMDESGSIDNNEWQTMKDFANKFTQAFKVGTNAARIGLVAYSSSPALRFSYQTDEQSFRNTMNSLTRYFGGGSTYTNSALRTAYDAYVNAARKGSVKHITVVITDGFCTCDNNQIISSSAPLKQDTVGYVFAVGVDGARTSELNALASGTDGKININGKEVQTSFFVSQWSQLNGILDQLIAATCTEFQGNPCTGCNGYCSCGKTCVCPNDCSSFGDFCNNGVCNAGNGFACRSEPKTNPDPCDDNNLCTNEYCSSQSQSCVRSNVVCPDKPCFITSCNPASGCAYTAKDCTDSDPCTAEFCNVTLDACDYSVPKPCDACKNLKLNATTCSEGKSKCEKWDCVQTGTATAECQKLADVNCDDLNACTIDSCDPTTGVCKNVPRTDCVDTDACTIDSCDPVGGCQFLTVNETAYCDDLNACTIDSCNSTIGCVYENVTCNTTFPCQVSVCNPLNGCELQPKNCADEPGIRDQLGDCYAALCNDGSGLVANVSSDAKLGCYLDLQPGAKVDDCGVCKGDGTTCGFPLTIAEVAGISAAIIGAIVAGAAAFAIVGAVGAKKGYDAYMRNKNNMSGAQSNPMYNDNGRSGQNPMYEMK